MGGVCVRRHHRFDARALVELQEDSRVFAIRFKRSFWQELVFGLVSEMDMFDIESLLEYPDGNSCLARPRYTLSEAVTHRGANNG